MLRSGIRELPFNSLEVTSIRRCQSDFEHVAHVTQDKIITRVGAKMERPIPIPEEPVHDRHAIAGLEDVLGEDGAEVTDPTRD
jgi:hypothetical protein